MNVVKESIDVTRFQACYYGEVLLNSWIRTLGRAFICPFQCYDTY